MWFGVLGPVDIVVDDRRIVLAGRRRRVLLVRLVTAANRVVSTERLVEDVWDGAAGAGARSTLASHVSYLRQLLGPDRITSRDGGYALGISPGMLDVSCFEADAAAGRLALVAGDPRDALEYLQRALGWWRGPALADVDGLAWSMGEVTRLEELRQSAADHLLRARLDLGEHHELIAAAEASVEEQPLREQRWATLMLALYRSGRQAEALGAYRRLRVILGEGLGIEPSAELVQLEESIVLQDRALDWRAPAHDGRAGLPAGGVRPNTTDVGAGRDRQVVLPSRLAEQPAVGVTGRSGECDHLDEAFKMAAAGDGRQVVLISGEAGIGKSTLAGATARRAHEAGAVVLLGRADEELGAPYGLLIEAVEHWVTHAPAWAVTASVGPHTGELARVVPALVPWAGGTTAPQSDDPETERYLLFEAAVGLIAQISEIQPVVLVLEDLQWADTPSLQVLRRLVASSQSMRLLVVGPFRDSGLAPSHPLIDTLLALQREPGVTKMVLSGLDLAGVTAYVEAAAGRGLGCSGAELAWVLSRETDGNPFFMGEVLRHLFEIGIVAQDDTGQLTVHGDLGAVPLPESVRMVISARAARLGAVAATVLTTASVIGREFDLDLLARVTEVDDDQLLDVLDSAVGSALVREISDVPGRYSFTHALVQHALSQDLGATRRARAHRRIALSLEKLYGADSSEKFGELAYHWSRTARPEDAANAASAARWAADAALESFAPDEAVALFAQAQRFDALQHDRDPLVGLDLLLGLGSAQRQAGMASFRETFLEAARSAISLGATERLVAAALGNTRGFFSAGGQIDTERLAVLEGALGAMGGDDSTERAVVLATMSSELAFGPVERRRTLADAALAMARRLGDPTTLVRVLILIDMPLQTPAELEERLANTAEATALAEGLDDPGLIFWAAAHGHVDAGQSGDFRRAARYLDTMRELSTRLRQPTMMWATTFCEATDALMAGDHRLTEERATTALEIGGASGQPDAFAIYASQMAWARFQQGRMGELVPLVKQVTAENPGVPAFRGFLALAHLEAGEEAAALRLLEVASDDGFTSLPRDFLWTSGIADYAEVAVELRAPGPAQRLFDLIAPFHDQTPCNGASVLDPFAFYLGGLASVLGDFHEAEARFGEAMTLSARGGRTFCEAHTRLGMGRMLTTRGRRGDVDLARGVLEGVLATARTHGYGGIERRAAGALSELR